MDPLTAVVGPRRIVPGWATVELDRAEAERREASVAPGTLRAAEVPDDDVLGARCRLIFGTDGPEVVLLEPSTEGRLAAALARHGEGVVAAYLLVGDGAIDDAGRAGFALSSERPGPFGRQRLVLAGPRGGPFLLLAGFGEKMPRP